MTLDELLERLRGYEWNDIEFKEAQRDVPRSSYETVSAFANTAGGWLVFGIQQNDSQFEIIGVIEVDKVQSDFLTVLRSRQKFNRIINVQESLLTNEDKTLLVFYIPESPRREKPVYLNGDIRQTYIRRGGNDVRCSEEEIHRFLREASDRRYDSEVIDIGLESCYDPESLRWYRKLFDERNPERDPSMSDVDFLREWGLVIEQVGKLLPTIASIILFGTPAILNQLLPRPVVDCQLIYANRADGLPDERWADRLVAETNLIQTWRSLLDFYYRHAERPFGLEPETLQREDIPPDNVAFREAAINLLIHQDYSDHGRNGLIQFFRDQTILTNPGDAFIPSDELLDPGDKEVRNPKIVNAFRRIGLSEAAGTGVTSIYRNWRQLGLIPPVINNDRSRKSFQLVLPKEKLVTESQLLFEAGLGVHLTDVEAAVFAYSCRQVRLGIVDIKAVTGLTTDRAREIANRLVVQGVLTYVDAIHLPYFELAPHIREMMEQAGGTASPILLELDQTQWKIIEVTDTPRTLGLLMDLAGVKRVQRENFVSNILQPLIRAHLIQLTRPDQPTHPRQAYMLTEIGQKLRQRRLGGM